MGFRSRLIATGRRLRMLHTPLLLLFASISFAQNYSTLEEAFPELQSLSLPPSKYLPNLGGQNFTYCCLKAVASSLKISNGSVQRNGTFISVEGNEFEHLQFP